MLDNSNLGRHEGLLAWKGMDGSMATHLSKGTLADAS